MIVHKNVLSTNLPEFSTGVTPGKSSEMPLDSERRTAVCSKCGSTKGLLDFHKYKHKLNGRSSWCKTCVLRKPSAKQLERKELLQHGLRKCIRCHQVLSLDSFSKTEPRCKPCNAERKRKPEAEVKRVWRRQLAEQGKKWCARCKEEKPINEFYKDADQPSGISTYCKPCKIVHRRKFHQRNPTYQREYLKKYIKTPHGRAKHKEYRKRYSAKPESKIKFREARNQRRARIYSAVRERVLKNQWTQILAFWNHRCAYCEESFLANKLTMDHVTPLTKNGSHTLENLIPACKPCNCKKRNSILPDALKRLGVDPAAFEERWQRHIRFVANLRKTDVSNESIS